MIRAPGPLAPQKQAPLKLSRRLRGFESASGLLTERIRHAGEKRGFAVTRLLTQWEAIVGADLAAITRPVKVGYTREGMGATLTLLVASAHAPVVQMEIPRMRERVNACYGYAAISRISLTQTAPGGFAEGQAAFNAAPAAPTPPDPAVQAKAVAAAEGVRDDGLRAALENLVRNFHMRAKR